MCVSVRPRFYISVFLNFVKDRCRFIHTEWNKMSWRRDLSYSSGIYLNICLNKERGVKHGDSMENAVVFMSDAYDCSWVQCY